jgi:carbamoyl-phosphate synthase large subunit
MAGEKLSTFPNKPPHEKVGDDVAIPMGDPMALADFHTPWYSVKEAVLPFARFPGVDTLLGPEMRSTGEVMGWDRSFARAFLKAQLGAGTLLPESGTVFFSIRDADKTEQLVETAEMLIELGLKILATRGTAAFLTENGIPSEVVNKAYEGGRTIVDVMKDGLVHMVINTTEGAQAIEDSRSMRNVTLMDKIPYFTTAAAGHAAALAMLSRKDGDVSVRSLQGA